MRQIVLHDLLDLLDLSNKPDNLNTIWHIMCQNVFFRSKR